MYCFMDIQNGSYVVYFHDAQVGLTKGYPLFHYDIVRRYNKHLLLISTDNKPCMHAATNYSACLLNYVHT